MNTSNTDNILGPVEKKFNTCWILLVLQYLGFVFVISNSKILQ
jgi:hypothetical protein